MLALALVLRAVRAVPREESPAEAIRAGLLSVDEEPEGADEPQPEEGIDDHPPIDIDLEQEIGEQPLPEMEPEQEIADEPNEEPIADDIDTKDAADQGGDDGITPDVMDQEPAEPPAMPEDEPSQEDQPPPPEEPPARKEQEEIGGSSTGLEKVMTVDDGLFQILDVNPDWAGEEGETEIVISFTPINKRVKYCRFGDIIVDAAVSAEDGKLRCKAPKHKPGLVKLSISKNKIAFFGSADFRFERKSKGFKKWIFFLGIVVFLAVLLTPRLRRILRRRRKVPLGLDVKETKGRRKGASRRQVQAFA